MLQIKKLTFGYHGAAPLFSKLELKLNAGNIYGLLGKNGAGKSSLLKIIAGLLFPQAGKCRVLGLEPRLRAPELLQEIYFIPEEFAVPAVTATEYLKLYAPFYPYFSTELFQRAMAEFSLDANKKLTELSYGQKKKFLISFGLATNCRVLLLDEPTNGLDIPSKSQFRKLLAGMLTEERSFIIATHQVHDVENLIDSLIVLDDGEVIFQHDLVEIATQLNFSQESNIDDVTDLIYQEKVFGGYNVISKNSGDYESRIDLELLFNAILTNKNKKWSLL